MKKLLKSLRESLGENFFDLSKPYVQRDGLKAVANQVEKRIAPSSDGSALKQLELHEIEELIKIYTVLGKREIISRGSASPVIILLGQLRAFSTAQYDDLLDWMLNTTEFADILDWVLKTNDCQNKHIPTGSIYQGDAHSLAEFRSMYGDYKAQKAQKAKNLSDTRERQIIDKKERERIRAEETIWNAIERNDIGAINAFMKKSGNLDLKNSDGVTVGELLKKMRYLKS